MRFGSVKSKEHVLRRQCPRLFFSSVYLILSIVSLQIVRDRSFNFAFSAIEYGEYLFSPALNSTLAANEFKALESKFILCNKFADIRRVGIKKCSSLLQLHIGGEASDITMYKQPNRTGIYHVTPSRTKILNIRFVCQLSCSSLSMTLRLSSTDY